MFTMGIACTPFGSQADMTAQEKRLWRVMGTLCSTLAIAFTLIAACRFFRQQYALMHGRVRLAGWDFYFVPLAVLAVEVGVLVVAAKY